MMPYSRWFKKRDFMVYYVLFKTYRGESFNLGEAIDLVRENFCFNRSTAISILRRLLKLGLITQRSKLEYACTDLIAVLDGFLSHYKNIRLSKCIKEK
ncbi:MAG: hypothetical protein QW224_03795 [Desulfurococcaceae archaeon]